MKLKRIVRNSMMLIVVMCNFGCDQITKTIVRQEIDYNESIRFISDHITLTKVENVGAFLSLGESLPWAIKFIFLSLLPIAILGGGMFLLLIKTHLSKAFLVGTSFVIGGGIGNVYDRLLYGSVTDFLYVDFILFQTGIFNMADVSIMLGVIVVFIELQLNKQNLFKNQTAS